MYQKYGDKGKTAFGIWNNINEQLQMPGCLPKRDWGEKEDGFGISKPVQGFCRCSHKKPGAQILNQNHIYLVKNCIAITFINNSDSPS